MIRGLASLQQGMGLRAVLNRQWGFPGGSDGKEPACNTGDPGSVPGLGRSPGEGSGNPLQYSYLENLMDRGHSEWDRKEQDTTVRLTLTCLLT